MEHLFGLASESRCLINRRYKRFVSTLHCALKKGADLYVNERQKIGHYHARSTEERRRRKNNAKLRFFTSCSAYVKFRYSDVIYTHWIGNQP